MMYEFLCVTNGCHTNCDCLFIQHSPIGFSGGSNLCSVPRTNRVCIRYVMRINWAFSRRFSSPRPGIDSRQVHVEFVVDKVGMGQIFLKYFGFPLSVSFCQCSTLIHSSILALNSFTKHTHSHSLLLSSVQSTSRFSVVNKTLKLLYPVRTRWGTYLGYCSRRDGALNSG